MHWRTRETGRKAPGGHTEEGNELDVPGREGGGAVREETAGGGHDAAAGFELVVPLLALVLPSRDQVGACPGGEHPASHTASRLHDDGGCSRGWRRIDGSCRLGRGGFLWQTIEGSFPESGEPSVKCGEAWSTLPHLVHHPSQSWPDGVGGDVETDSPLDDGKGEALEREDFCRQETSRVLALRAADHGNVDNGELGLLALGQPHDAALCTPSRPLQRTSESAMTAAQRGWKR